MLSFLTAPKGTLAICPDETDDEYRTRIGRNLPEIEKIRMQWLRQGSNTNRIGSNIEFDDWCRHTIPAGIEARMILRGRDPHDKIYRICMWTLKKFCAVEVIDR
jgi:hypothetical protein